MGNVKITICFLLAHPNFNGVYDSEATTATPSLENGVRIGVHFLGLTEEDWLAMKKFPETAKPAIAEIKRTGRKQKIPIR